MENFPSRLEELLSKLGHNLHDVRARALRNLTFKIQTSMLDLSSKGKAQQIAQRLGALVAEALNKKGEDPRTCQEVLKLASFLTQTIAGKEALLEVGFIELLTQLKKTKDCGQVDQALCNHILEELLSLKPPESKLTGIIMPPAIAKIETQVILSPLANAAWSSRKESFEDSHDENLQSEANRSYSIQSSEQGFPGISNGNLSSKYQQTQRMWSAANDAPLQTLQVSNQGHTLNLTSAEQSWSASQALLPVQLKDTIPFGQGQDVEMIDFEGFKLPSVKLTREDEKLLIDLEIRFRTIKESSELIDWCCEVKTSVLVDFPAEVIMQRPGKKNFLSQLLGLLHPSNLQHSGVVKEALATLELFLENLFNVSIPKALHPSFAWNLPKKEFRWRPNSTRTQALVDSLYSWWYPGPKIDMENDGIQHTSAGMLSVSGTLHRIFTALFPLVLLPPSNDASVVAASLILRIVPYLREPALVGSRMTKLDLFRFSDYFQKVAQALEIHGCHVSKKSENLNMRNLCSHLQTVWGADKAKNAVPSFCSISVIHLATELIRMVPVVSVCQWVSGSGNDSLIVPHSLILLITEICTDIHIWQIRPGVCTELLPYMSKLNPKTSQAYYEAKKIGGRLHNSLHKLCLPSTANQKVQYYPFSSEQVASEKQSEQMQDSSTALLSCLEAVKCVFHAFPYLCGELSENECCPTVIIEAIGVAIHLWVEVFSCTSSIADSNFNRDVEHGAYQILLYVFSYPAVPVRGEAYSLMLRILHGSAHPPEWFVQFLQKHLQREPALSLDLHPTVLSAMAFGTGSTVGSLLPFLVTHGILGEKNAEIQGIVSSIVLHVMEWAWSNQEQRSELKSVLEDLMPILEALHEGDCADAKGAKISFIEGQLGWLIGVDDDISEEKLRCYHGLLGLFRKDPKQRRISALKLMDAGIKLWGVQVAEIGDPFDFEASDQLLRSDKLAILLVQEKVEVEGVGLQLSDIEELISLVCLERLELPLRVAAGRQLASALGAQAGSTCKITVTTLKKVAQCAEILATLDDDENEGPITTSLVIMWAVVFFYPSVHLKLSISKVYFHHHSEEDDFEENICVDWLIPKILDPNMSFFCRSLLHDILIPVLFHVRRWCNVSSFECNFLTSETQMLKHEDGILPSTPLNFDELQKINLIPVPGFLIQAFDLSCAFSLSHLQPSCATGNICLPAAVDIINPFADSFFAETNLIKMIHETWGLLLDRATLDSELDCINQKEYDALWSWMSPSQCSIRLCKGLTSAHSHHRLKKVVQMSKCWCAADPTIKMRLAMTNLYDTFEIILQAPPATLNDCKLLKEVLPFLTSLVSHKRHMHTNLVETQLFAQSAITAFLPVLDNSWQCGDTIEKVLLESVRVDILRFFISLCTPKDGLDQRIEEDMAIPHLLRNKSELFSLLYQTYLLPHNSRPGSSDPASSVFETKQQKLGTCLALQLLTIIESCSNMSEETELSRIALVPKLVGFLAEHRIPDSMNGKGKLFHSLVCLQALSSKKQYCLDKEQWCDPNTRDYDERSPLEYLERLTSNRCAMIRQASLGTLANLMCNFPEICSEAIGITDPIDNGIEGRNFLGICSRMALDPQECFIVRSAVLRVLAKFRAALKKETNTIEGNEQHFGEHFAQAVNGLDDLMKQATAKGSFVLANSLSSFCNGYLVHENERCQQAMLTFLQDSTILQQMTDHFLAVARPYVFIEQLVQQLCGKYDFDDPDRDLNPDTCHIFLHGWEKQMTSIFGILRKSEVMLKISILELIGNAVTRSSRIRNLLLKCTSLLPTISNCIVSKQQTLQIDDRHNDLFQTVRWNFVHTAASVLEKILLSDISCAQRNVINDEHVTSGELLPLPSPIPGTVAVALSGWVFFYERNTLHFPSCSARDLRVISTSCRLLIILLSLEHWKDGIIQPGSKKNVETVPGERVAQNLVPLTKKMLRTKVMEPSEGKVSETDFQITRQTIFAALAGLFQSGIGLEHCIDLMRLLLKRIQDLYSFLALYTSKEPKKQSAKILTEDTFGPEHHQAQHELMDCLMLVGATFYCPAARAQAVHQPIQGGWSRLCWRLWPRAIRMQLRGSDRLHGESSMLYLVLRATCNFIADEPNAKRSLLCTGTGQLFSQGRTAESLGNLRSSDTLLNKIIKLSMKIRVDLSLLKLVCAVLKSACLEAPCRSLLIQNGYHVHCIKVISEAANKSATKVNNQDATKALLHLEVLVNLTLASEGQHALLQVNATQSLFNTLFDIQGHKVTSWPSNVKMILLLLRNLCQGRGNKDIVVSGSKSLQFILFHLSQKGNLQVSYSALSALWSVLYHNEKLLANGSASLILPVILKHEQCINEMRNSPTIYCDQKSQLLYSLTDVLNHIKAVLTTQSNNEL